VISRVINLIASWHLGERIDDFVGLFGTTVARSNGVMLERATVRCRRDEGYALRQARHRSLER
jgi:hypothetical protein